MRKTGKSASSSKTPVTKNKAKVGDIKSIKGNTILRWTSKDLGGKSEEKKSSSTKVGNYDSSGLINSPEFKRLSAGDQKAVSAVFGAIAGNDKTQADRLSKAFSAASKINDPYFKQQLRLAQDAIERGYVSIDKEKEFEEKQIKNRLEDLRADFDKRRGFLNAEEASVMRDIERTYTENLGELQQNLAASGFGSSSIRLKKEGILEDATSDLRESTNRKFGFEQDTLRDNFNRSSRDSRAELRRLEELTKENKLDFLRTAEAKVGTDNLPRLSGAPKPLGKIYGSLPEEKLQNTIDAAKSFVF